MKHYEQPKLLVLNFRGDAILSSALSDDNDGADIFEVLTGGRSL